MLLNTKYDSFRFDRMRRGSITLSVLTLICMMTLLSIFPVINGNELKSPCSQKNNNFSINYFNILTVGDGQQYTSIQNAIDNAYNGDTIQIYSGNYSENIFINKTLSLFGNGTSSTFITGALSQNTTVVNSDNCIITGITFLGDATSPFSGILIKSDNNSIIQCNISNTYLGIYSISSNNNTIVDCELYNLSGYGVYLYKSCNNTIRNTSVEKYFWHGIEFSDNSNNNTAENCSCGYSNTMGDGFFLRQSNNNEIKNCSSYKNGNSGIFSTVSSHLFVYNCTIKNNDNVGISVSSDDNYFINNIICNNGNYGLYINANRNQIINNIIQKHDWYGVWIVNGDNSQVFHNSFINNNGGQTQARDDGSLNYWNTDTAGNYWNDKTIPDNNRNAIVDNTYDILGTGGSKDENPLTLPFGSIWINVSVNKIANENQEYFQKFYAIDFDTSEDNFIWYYKSNASWLSFSDQRILTGIPDSTNLGKYWVNVSVSDGNYHDWINYTIIVENVNEKPLIKQIPVIEIYEDKPFSYICTASDPDDDELKWRIDEGTPFLSIDTYTGELFGIPRNEHVGSWLIRINVTDEGYLWSTAETELVVINTNDCPQIIGDEEFFIDEDEDFWITFFANDPDINDVHFYWDIETNATWLTLDDRGNLSGTPKNDHVGMWEVNISIQDNNGSKGYHNIKIFVSNTNDDPEIQSTYLPIAVEDIEYHYMIEAFDIDPVNNDLTWDIITTNCTFMMLNPFSGEIYCHPNNTNVGIYFILIEVTDNHGGSDRINFSFAVQNVNDDPIIITTEFPILYYEVFFNFPLEVIDIDPTNDFIKWTIESSNVDFFIDEETGLISGTPKMDTKTEKYIILNISDGKGGYNSRKYILNIQEIPSISLSSIEDYDFSFDFNEIISNFNEPKCKLSYISSINFSILIDNNIALFNPNLNWNGDEDVTFMLYLDHYILPMIIHVSITQVNDKPFNVSITASSTYSEGSSIILRGNANDVDIQNGDTLTFKWSSDISGPLGIGEIINFTLPAGIHKITLEVIDTHGAYEFDTTEIEILPKEEEINEDTNSMIILMIILLIFIILLIIIVFFIVWKKKMIRNQTSSDQMTKDEASELIPKQANPLEDNNYHRNEENSMIEHVNNDDNSLNMNINYEKRGE